MTNTHHHARFDAKSGGLVIEAMTITQDAVVSESRHWATGRRGEAAEPEALAEADLGPFIEQALTIGAAALTTAGGTQQAYAVEKLVTEAEQRSQTASALAAEQTAQAVRAASESLTKTTADTARLVGASIEDANKKLVAEITRLVGGQDPELVRRLQPILDSTVASMKAQTVKDTSDLLDKVTRAFNPSDPTSPMAVQMRTLTEAQQRQAKVLSDEQHALAAKLDEVMTALKVKEAHAKVVAGTALKGGTYEEQVHSILAEIAAGLGDEYLETGTITGLRSRSKKGDGVLGVNGGDVRVVVEMTDSARPHWTEYLAEAEENRGAHAALGLARSADQLGGQTMLTLGPRRIILAFDPENDDPQLVRCVLQLLRQAAEVAACRVETGEVATAEEAISEALAALATLDKLKRVAGQIRTGANTVDTDATTLQTDMLRWLTKAKTALAGVHQDVSHAA